MSIKIRPGNVIRIGSATIFVALKGGKIYLNVDAPQEVPIDINADRRSSDTPAKTT